MNLYLRPKGKGMAEEHEHLITYCGLYCGDCFAHKGTIADLARDLRKELRDAHFDKTAETLSDIPFFKEYKNYKECYEVLGAMVRFRCNKVCRDGGGPPFCKMRKCCQKKGIKGCWECPEFETCKKLDFITESHGDAPINNLRILKKKGPKEFISGKRQWFAPPKNRKNSGPGEI
jgi:hypothetical protein